MALTEYDLPEFTDVQGTWKIRLYSATAGLTIPTENTILAIGERREKVEPIAGIAEMETLEIQLQDDFTVYTPEGFWFRVLQGETYIRFALNEGGTDKFFFFGQPLNQSQDWKEVSLGTPRIRICNLTLTTVAQKLFDTTVANWAQGILNNGVSSGYTNPTAIASGITLAGIFSSLLEASTLNATYDVTDTTLVFDASNPDFKYKIGATEYDISELFFATKYDNTGAPQTVEYYDNTSGQYLVNTFQTSRDLVKSLLTNFGLAMRLTYDLANSRHTIQLIQRTRAYSGTLSFDSTEEESDIRKSYDLQADAVRITRLRDTTKYAWVSKRFSGGVASVTTPQDLVDFALDVRIPFVIDAPVSPGLGYAIFAGAAITSAAEVDGIEYYDHSTDAYAAPGTPSMVEKAVALYFYARYVTSFANIERTYDGITADAGAGYTFTALSILRRTSINDGLNTKTYLAESVTLNPKDNVTKINWVEE